MVLDLAPHHAEGVVASVMVDVNSAEACGASSWDPLLVGIIVDHDSSPSLADALFTVETHSIRSQEATQHSPHSLLAHTLTHTPPDTWFTALYVPERSCSGFFLFNGTFAIAASLSTFTCTV